MKFLIRILSLVALIFMWLQNIHGIATKGTGSCPIKETVKICLPRCLNDYECVGNKRCCLNSCGHNSCAEVSPVPTGDDSKQKGSPVMCANQRCLPGQKCISESSMKRPKCSW